MNILPASKRAWLSLLLIPFGWTVAASAQDFNPINKTTSPPGSATYPDPITSGYNSPPAATPATAANAPAVTNLSGVTPSPLSASDRQFIHVVIEGGIFEVEAGQYAGTAGHTMRVRHFGRHVAADHTAINRELTDLATAQGLTVPQNLHAPLQAKLDMLTGLTGAAFDSAYIHAMVRAHEKDIVAFENAAANASDPDLRAFASRNLPTLRAHLEMAQNAESHLN